MKASEYQGKMFLELRVRTMKEQGGWTLCHVKRWQKNVRAQ